MMGGVCHQAIGAQGARQSGIRIDPHVVHAGIACSVRIVSDGVRELTGYVLHQRSTEGDVHDLDPAANGECWQAPPMGFENQRDLALIALFVRLDSGVGLLAITSRRHVLSAGDHETSHSGEYNASCRRGEGREDERHETGIGECRGVREVHANARYAANDFGRGGDGHERRIDVDRHCQDECCVGTARLTILSPLYHRGHQAVFENLRKSLDDLLSRSTPPEERRQIVSRMRDTLVQAKMGLEDLRTALETSKRRLETERRELDTVQRRKRLAEQINDAETARLASQYEQMHLERVNVLSRKLEAQESELSLAERDVAQMMTELRQAASGIPTGADRSAAAMNAAMDEIESDLDAGKNESLGQEIDGLSRARTRADHEADAARKLEELKRRMGK